MTLIYEQYLGNINQDNIFLMYKKTLKINIIVFPASCSSCWSYVAMFVKFKIMLANQQNFNTLKIRVSKPPFLYLARAATSLFFRDSD